MSVPEQLDAGAHLLGIEIHRHPYLKEVIISNGEPVNWLKNGHTSLSRAFTQIKSWVDANPETVITLSLEIKDKFPGRWDMRDLIREKLTKSGLGEKIFSDNSQRQPGDKWPSQQELIDAGRTVMIFGFQNEGAYSATIPANNPTATAEELGIEFKQGEYPFSLKVESDIPAEALTAIAGEIRPNLEAQSQRINSVLIKSFDPTNEALLEAVRNASSAPIPVQTWGAWAGSWLGL
jgi:hypothetical protein